MGVEVSLVLTVFWKTTVRWRILESKLLTTLWRRPVDSLNLISLLGLVVMVALAWLVSSARTQVNWRLVLTGVALQAILAAVLFQSQSWTFDRSFESLSVLSAAQELGEISADQVTAGLTNLDKESAAEILDAIQKGQSFDKYDQQITEAGGVSIPRFPNGVLFWMVNSVFDSIKSYVDKGASFVFDARGNNVLLNTFVFGILPTVIFFASLMAVLYHLGVMQRLVAAMAWVMQKTLGTSGPESMAAAANVLVGHTEAPLVVRPYIENMTRSELNALMVGGFATISGSLMVVFVQSGISAGHLLTASLISAPAALVIAKIMQPETETPRSAEMIQPIDDSGENNATNVIEAAAIGASDGVKLAINIAAMLIAFLALLAMFDAILYGVGELAEWVINQWVEERIDLQWSINGLFSILFFPLAWVMGIETADCGIAGELLGKKVSVNEFVAYLDMANYIDDEGPRISERTQVILTYALCGFSNFGAIGIQIGGIGPLAPGRRSDLAQLGLRAMFGGMLAACMTACMAGVMYGVLR